MRGSAPVHHPGSIEVDPIAMKRHSLLTKQLPLNVSLGNTPIGSNDPVPWEFLIRRRQHLAHQTRRFRIHVAIRLD